MKKLAIGCGVVVLVCGVALVGIGYYSYVRVRSAVTQLAELRKIPEIEQDVRVKTPFVVPSSGELTVAQLERFMKVQTRVRDRLGSNFDTLQRNYQSLAEKGRRNETSVTDLPALMAAYRDMAGAWLDAKRTQVAALNEVGLSLDEYRWIRSQAYGALGIPMVDVDFARIADQAKKASSDGVMLGGAFSGSGPASNKPLVEPYRKQLENNMPLSAFGL